jgi:uncharacterized protein with von Willebrand factor type A (vWA) domain
MFSHFFYFLRSEGIPVSTSEYLDLLNALEQLMQTEDNFSSAKFYQVGRNILIKDLKYYDAYDIAFAKCFGDVIDSEDFRKKIEEWLKNAFQKELSEEQMQKAMKLPNEDLLKELQKRLEEQKERHDGGNFYLGTGGTSAFGHSGYNPEGIRVGGSSSSRSALAVAGQRSFKNYRHDINLDVRNIKVALKKLRSLKKSGRAELDIKKTIRKTCDDGGEIDLVFSKSRKNNLRVVLLMDIGGSMTPHSERVEQLFSAAHQVNHFKEFKHYYFHNIFYDDLYTDASLNPRHVISMDELHFHFPKDTRFIIVGDAYMAPYELFMMTGRMREYYRSFQDDKRKSDLKAIQRVKRLKEHYENVVWLNPESKELWEAPTIHAIRNIIPMFSLTIEGVEDAISNLI